MIAWLIAVLIPCGPAWAETTLLKDCPSHFSAFSRPPTHLENALIEAKQAGLTATRMNPSEHRIPFNRVAEALKNRRQDVTKLQKRLTEIRAGQENARRAQARAEAELGKPQTGAGPASAEQIDKVFKEFKAALDTEHHLYADAAKLELAIEQAESSLRGSPYAFEAARFQISSPEIARFQQDGILNDVILLDRSIDRGSYHAGGDFNPLTKDLRLTPPVPTYIFGREIESDSLVGKFRHELVHAMADAKSAALTRSSGTGELRGHPFLFSSTTRIQNPEWPYKYQHASEVTAYRAGAVNAEKESRVSIAFQHYESSNKAIERNLEALSRVRKIVADELYQQGLYQMKRYGQDTLYFSFDDPGGRTLVEFPFEYRGPQDNYSQKDLLAYLDFLKRANMTVKEANDRDIRRLRSRLPAQ